MTYEFPPSDEEALLTRELADQMAEIYGFPQDAADKIGELLDQALTRIMNEPGLLADQAGALGTSALDKSKFAAVAGSILVCGVQGWLNNKNRFTACEDLLSLAAVHTRLKRGL